MPPWKMELLGTEALFCIVAAAARAPGSRRAKSWSGIVFGVWGADPACVVVVVWWSGGGMYGMVCADDDAQSGQSNPIQCSPFSGSQQLPIAIAAAWLRTGYADANKRTNEWCVVGGDQDGGVVVYETPSRRCKGALLLVGTGIRFLTGNGTSSESSGLHARDSRPSVVICNVYVDAGWDAMRCGQQRQTLHRNRGNAWEVWDVWVVLDRSNGAPPTRSDHYSRLFRERERARPAGSCGHREFVCETDRV